MPREAIVVPDVGLNQIWTVRTWQSHSPRSLLTSGGMGPMGDLPCDEAKIFASAYALFSGLIFITVTGIVLGGNTP